MEIVRGESGLGAARGCVLVPTMGALHEGHRSLIARAAAIGRAERRAVVVSVFVNPTQFNEKADFERYPRDLDADASLCAGAGATHVFAPAVEVMYPPGRAVRVPTLPAVAVTPGLEDRWRPGHFEGVCQVCLRLFELTGCGAAVFGEKDWQQLQTVRAMVGAEGLALRIEAATTVRERDGLAMSSRNRLLSPNDRSRAAALARALEVAGMRHSVDDAERAGLAVLDAAGLQSEYFAVRDAETLGELSPGRPARALVAARVVRSGATGGINPGEAGVRLIDNAQWPGFVRGE